MGESQVDFITGLIVDDRIFPGELEALTAMRVGLSDLYLRMAEFEARIPDELDFPAMPFWESADDARLAACRFSWYGVMVLNYARFVGYLHAVLNEEFDRVRELIAAEATRVRVPVDRYVDSVVELGDVRRWRNKVGAHQALTDPRTSGRPDPDHAGRLYGSGLVVCEAENGRYWSRKREVVAAGVLDDTPRWSLTRLHEDLAPRWWPTAPRAVP